MAVDSGVDISAVKEILSNREKIDQAKKILVEETKVSTNPNTVIQAAVVYSLCGSISQTSKETRISQDTIKKWANSSWWDRILEIAKDFHDRRLDAKILGMREGTLAAMQDRLVHGDISYKYVKKKKKKKTDPDEYEKIEVRTPIPLKELNTVFSTLSKDQRETRKNKSTVKATDQEKGALKSIEKKLAEMGRIHRAKDVTPKSREEEVIDEQPKKRKDSNR